MSNILVVCYSWTGSSRRLARLLCSQQPNWQLGEIHLEKPRNGRAGYWQCVLDSILRRRPAIHYTGPIPSTFDAVVLVSPIWAFSLCSPMRSFIHTRRHHLPDVAVISVMGGAGATRAVREVERLIGRPSVMNTAFTMQAVEDDTATGPLQAFGDALRRHVDADRGHVSPHLASQTA